MLKTIEAMTTREAMRTAWLKLHLHGAGLARWSADHPYVASALLYGTLAYLGVAVLIGMPGRAIIALMIGGPAVWWCFGRYTALKSAKASTLSFFGPLHLSEDILSPRIVYCIGIRNEGAKAVGKVRVNIDAVEGHPRPAVAASLPIFRTPASSTDLQPGEAEYFCIARMMDGSTADERTVAICCHENAATPSFGLRELVDGRSLTLSACGDGASSTTRRIRISWNRQAGAARPLHLELLPDADEAPIQVVEKRPMAPPPAAESVARPPPQEPVARPRMENPVAPPPTEDPVARPPMESPAAQPATEETPSQSERVRRLLARQSLRTGSK